LNYEDLDFYSALSGERLAATDLRMLTDYTDIFGEFYCRHACGKCEAHCPHGVPVNTIMRYQHYFCAQRREKYAMEKYASLPAGMAGLCSDCSGYCTQACPHQVPIQGLLMMAHQNLVLRG
jgi:predicted aldo/keto reductase-like oxidoreductase